eukprot:CAMPEP_0201519370 /NCGR_PEP_ID=MMETSP0161_2-20130828/9942_1 /ASSEMBLY_ACC=CAM_ASM_000251 /TAXON_ID=180227 /ORGANISM="Neoparamoeba aestuarina, Strain SoJaBio B1-5/56/2" /LENGTH=213 /DNA_ID=CAMNT_0047917385 /DNA_START=61 /DNA_END=703 /DNA_ORIENTATION=-
MGSSHSAHKRRRRAKPQTRQDMGVPDQLRLCIFSLNSNVGKTSLILSYLNIPFQLDEMDTRDHFLKKVRVEGVEGEKIVELLDDTANDEDYHYCFLEQKLRESNAFFLVFSGENEHNAENIRQMLTRIDRIKDIDDVFDWYPLILVENKIDKNPSFDYTEIVEIAKINDIGYMRTSVATGENVKNLFESMYQWYFAFNKIPAKATRVAEWDTV